MRFIKQQNATVTLQQQLKDLIYSQQGQHSMNYSQATQPLRAQNKSVIEPLLSRLSLLPYSLISPMELITGCKNFVLLNLEIAFLAQIMPCRNGVR